MVYSEHWVLTMKIFKFTCAAVNLFASGLLITAATVSSPAEATPPSPGQLPSGPSSIGGQASVAQMGSIMSINQSTPQAAFSWNSFNIGSGATVNINQPSSSSVLLNQVIGNNASQIFGRLNANGQVFLTNPSGIYFSPSASVNVGGLVATTNSIGSTEFMGGLRTFSSSGSPAAVINEGNLQSSLGGYIALMAPTVRNNGVIVAQMGTVVLAAGNLYGLQFTGNSLNTFTVSPATIATLVSNGNAVFAPGGLIILSAQAARQLKGGVIGNTGVLDATGITSHGGVIELTASHTINAGGTIKSDAAIGSATNGGTISIVADLTNPSSQTNLTGTLSAQGGSLGGNGGQLETSASSLRVSPSAFVNASAVKGITGDWLLDPNSFIIDSVLNAGDMTSATLVNNLLAANITILSSSGRGGTLGDIQVNQPISWAGATTLTLNAAHDVLVNNAITANTAGATLSLIAGHDVDVNSTLATIGAGATLLMSAGNNVNLSSGITGTAANTTIGIAALQNVTTLAPINAVAGASRITITGGVNVSINGAITATAASSAIAINAGLDITSNAAIAAIAATTTISLTAGRDITTTTTAAMSAGAATSQISLDAGRNISVNSAIAAGAAGSSIYLISGLAGTGPGLSSGTVTLVGAVASPSVTIRFNPDSYTNTAADIALYPALSDARAWVYAIGNNKVYDGTTAATLVLSSNPSVGAIVSLNPGSASFVNKNVGVADMINFIGYSLGGSNAPSFALISASGTTTANITQRPAIVSAQASNKTYDGTPLATVSLSAPTVAGDVLNLTYGLSSFTNPSVGIAKTVNVTGITGSGINAGNYSLNTSAVSTANVNQAPLTVVASNLDKNYGQTPILTQFTQVGLVNSETIGSVSLTSSGTNSKAPVTGSPYLITPSNALGGSFQSSNYNITYVSGHLFVLPVGLIITVADAVKPFGSVLIPTAFTFSGLVNGETIGAISETSPGTSAAASIEGSPYVIAPSLASGGTFNPANYAIQYINGSLTVVPPSP